MKLITAFVLPVALLVGCGMSSAGDVTSPGTPGALSAKGTMDPGNAARLFSSLTGSPDGSLTLPAFNELGIFALVGNSLNGGPIPNLSQAQETVFKELDKDGDGKLTEAEFDNFGTTVLQGVANMAENPARLTKVIDLNHDGNVSFEEWQQLGLFGGVWATDQFSDLSALTQSQFMTFAEFQQDDNGSLTPKEFQQYCKLLYTSTQYWGD